MASLTTEPPGFDYHPDFLPPARADALLEALWRDIDWRQESIQLFGKPVPQPRLTAWFADPGVRYAYSGLVLEPCPFPDDIEHLRKTLQVKLGLHFNAVLLNGYRDGQDSMGWHADDEPELGPHPAIASISLGGERVMRIRPRGGGSSTALTLAHGSLVLMSASSQRDYQHAIPKTRRAVAPRINLTFRRVFPPGEARRRPA